VSRVWTIVILLVIALAVLLTLNTITVNNETKGAETTADGAEILELSGGDVQVVETPAETDNPGAPIVLIHAYAASLHWWDSMVPLLAEDHRVITLDLLGHGGSEKPSSGYAIEDQAGLVAEALNELEVQGAVVVGHSLGGAVATSLAEQSSELVDRVVIVDTAPDTSYSDLPFEARLGYVPVLGQLLNRVIPDSFVKRGFEEAFAPDYDIDDAFENPDRVVDDFEAMTYTSYDENSSAFDDYTDEISLDERMRDAAVPLLVIYGAEEQIVDDDEEALAAYQEVPGARIATVEDAGHSPNVEQPEETAELILEFAADAGDEVLPAPEAQGGGAKAGGDGQRREKGKAKAKKDKGRRAHEDEDQPNQDKNPGEAGGGDGGKAEKGQEPPPDDRPGGDG
jgi:pimeloyl-ACP methyl ester carboxylesterase